MSADPLLTVRINSLCDLRDAHKQQDDQDSKRCWLLRAVLQHVHKWQRTKAGPLTSTEKFVNNYAIFQIFVCFFQAFVSGINALLCCRFNKGAAGDWQQQAPPGNVQCTRWNVTWWQVSSAFFFLTSVVAMVNQIPAWRQLSLRDQLASDDDTLLFKTEYFLGSFIRHWCEAFPVFVLNAGLQGTFISHFSDIRHAAGPTSYASFSLSVIQLVQTMWVLPKGVYVLFWSPFATFIEHNSEMRKVFAFSAAAPCIMFPIVGTFLLGYVRQSFALIVVSVAFGWLAGPVVPMCFRYVVRPETRRADHLVYAPPPYQEQGTTCSAWVCPACTYQNDEPRPACEMCGCARPQALRHAGGHAATVRVPSASAGDATSRTIYELCNLKAHAQWRAAFAAMHLAYFCVGWWSAQVGYGAAIAPTLIILNCLVRLQYKIDTGRDDAPPSSCCDPCKCHCTHSDTGKLDTLNLHSWVHSFTALVVLLTCIGIISDAKDPTPQCKFGADCCGPTPVTTTWAVTLP